MRDCRERSALLWSDVSLLKQILRTTHVAVTISKVSTIQVYGMVPPHHKNHLKLERRGDKVSAVLHVN